MFTATMKSRESSEAAPGVRFLVSENLTSRMPSAAGTSWEPMGALPAAHDNFGAVTCDKQADSWQRFDVEAG